MGGTMSDEWEMPEAYYQVCLKGGFIIDLSDADAKALQGIIDSPNNTIGSPARRGLYYVDDIYGSECVFKVSDVLIMRHWNQLSGQRYKKAHSGTDWYDG